MQLAKRPSPTLSEQNRAEQTIKGGCLSCLGQGDVGEDVLAPGAVFFHS